MKLLNILDNLSNKELLNTKSSRRGSISQFTNTSKNIALASIPFALAATSSKSKAATASMSAAAFQATPTEVLNFALTLEYLERNFYQIAMDKDGFIPAADRAVFGQILKHETSHVEFFKAAVESLGEEAIAEPTFDFTGGPGGLALDTFENYQTFLALSQGFEDTGVRAFKGQAGALANNNDLLTFALQVHSVEARHASQVRRMRGEKGWVTGGTAVSNGLPDLPEFDAIYAGEANTEQGGVQLAGLFGSFGGPQAVQEAFDEPLTMDEVLAIGGVFIVPADSDN